MFLGHINNLKPHSLATAQNIESLHYLRTVPKISLYTYIPVNP